MSEARSANANGQGSASVRKATAADIEAVVGLAASVAEAPQWARSVYAAAVKPPQGPVRRRVLVAAFGGSLVGFAVVACAGDEAELESIAVSEAARRRGLGRALCEAAIGWARECGAATMLLEVRSQSTGARALYRALGFTETGTRRAYYREPADDAVLMRFEIARAERRGIYNGEHGS